MGGWILPALSQGGAILVATPAHAKHVLAFLESSGLDAGTLQREGRLVVLDAEETMAKFMVGGMPEADRFHQLLEGVLSRLERTSKAPPPEFRAWGEMVNLLWKGGNLPAAQRLEDLWNEAIAARGFRLLCSYHLEDPRPPDYLGLLKDLTRGHSVLLPREDQARFDAEIFSALAANVGPEESDGIWNLLLTHRALNLELPPAEAVLTTVAELMPELGARVFEASRAETGSPVGVH